MELIYRGQRYHPKTVAATPCVIDFPCVYRGVSYRISSKRPSINSAPKQVQLTYRGIPYTRML